MEFSLVQILDTFDAVYELVYHSLCFGSLLAVVIDLLLLLLHYQYFLSLHSRCGSLFASGLPVV